MTAWLSDASASSCNRTSTKRAGCQAPCAYREGALSWWAPRPARYGHNWESECPIGSFSSTSVTIYGFNTPNLWAHSARLCSAGSCHSRQTMLLLLTSIQAQIWAHMDQAPSLDLWSALRSCSLPPCYLIADVWLSRIFLKPILEL